ncbi:hypothetical protein NHF46_21655 [Arthrobacter alpinus]|nr:hypothetical protein [Arthrobacter alpinus]
MSAPRPARSFGAADFIMIPLLASVLLVTTACGGAATLEAAPASETAAQSVTQSATPSPTPSPTPRQMTWPPRW